MVSIRQSGVAKAANGPATYPTQTNYTFCNNEAYRHYSCLQNAINSTGYKLSKYAPTRQGYHTQVAWILLPCLCSGHLPARQPWSMGQWVLILHSRCGRLWSAEYRGWPRTPQHLSVYSAQQTLCLLPTLTYWDICWITHSSALTDSLCRQSCQRSLPCMHNYFYLRTLLSASVFINILLASFQ